MWFIRFSEDRVGGDPRPVGQLSFDGPGVGVTLPVRFCRRPFYLAADAVISKTRPVAGHTEGEQSGCQLFTLPNPIAINFR
jgi:hypothetical protein